MSREKRMPELSSDARSFLARARDARGRDVARERRVGARIAASVAVAAAIPATASAATGSAITIGVVLRVVAAVVLVGGAASLPVWRATPAPIPDVAPVHAPASPPAPTHSAPIEVAPAVVIAPPPAIDPPSSPSRLRARRPEVAPAIVTTPIVTAPVVVAPVAPSEDEIAADVALLTRGVRALRDGDADHAATLLREHAERYPQSQFAPERDAALARAVAAGAADVP